jgi:hypothetical protein
MIITILLLPLGHISFRVTSAMSMLEDFRFVRRWALADSTASDRNEGHDVYPGSGLRRVIPYILLV